jgi:hypothetical protein
MTQIDFSAIEEQYRSPGVVSIVLMGSHARGDAGPYSDVDIVRFCDSDPQRAVAETHLIDAHFVVISAVGPSKVSDWFSKPEEATASISGIRAARPLWDPDGHFERIQNRAVAFEWDAAMQDKANAYASAEMVGLIEEVQKGLEGLRRHDIGRLLNARFGLSWGLTKVMRVQRGILISGDNASYAEVLADIGAESEWAEASRHVFGLTGLSLSDQVKAGLRLYRVTARLLDDILHERDRPLVHEVMRRVNRAV